MKKRCPSLCLMSIGAVLFLIFTLAAHPSVSAVEYQLPDTGQDKCYDDSKEIPCPSAGQDYYGQDAQYQVYQPSFQDNGDGTVMDLNTGLMWQQGDDENDWQASVDYCDALDLAGYQDWRIPTIGELETLVNAGRAYPAIDTQYFPDCRSSSYWSGSTNVHYADGAWVVYFYSGYVHYYFKSSALYVRCVREGP